MLTGDKTETAMNIGYSAGLLGPEMILIRLQDQDRGQTVTSLKLQLQGLILLFKQLAADKTDIDRIYSKMQDSVNLIIFGRNNREKEKIKKKKNENKIDPKTDGIRRRKLSNQEEYGLSLQEDLEDSMSPLLPSTSNTTEEEKYQNIDLDQLTSENLALIVDG